MTGTRRAPLALLAICVFFAICTEMLPVGLLPEIGRGLGVSTSATGVLVSLYAVLVAVTSVPITAYAERWPRRSVLVFLLGTYALSNVVFAVAPGYGVAVVARVIGGLAHAGFFAVAVAAAVSLVEEARAGRAIALVMSGNAVALVLGVPLGTFLGTTLGWRWAFAALAVVLVALAVTVLRVLPGDARPASAAAAGGDPVMSVVRRRAVLVMATVITLAALGHFTLYTYVSPLLLHAGVPRVDVGAALFGYGCGGLVGLAVAGAVVTRWPGRALVADLVLMGLSLVLAATVGSTVGIIAMVALWGVAFGAFPTLTQTVMLHAADGATDAAAALVNATTNAGIAGGALAGSVLLGVIDVPGLGWVGVGLVAASLGLYATRGNGRPDRAVRPRMTTLGLIGSGHIGGTLARLAVDAGDDVVLSNSRGPETLADLVEELGPHARAATAAEAAAAGDLVVVTVPFKAYDQVPVEPLRGKTVIDTNNYYPDRDGHVAALDDESTTSSEMLQAHLPESHVVKAFNNIYFEHLRALARRSGDPERSVIAIAGDDAEAKQEVTALLDRIGYDAYDVGSLAEGWRFQRDTAAYAGVYATDGDFARPQRATAADLEEKLAAAQRYADMTD